MFDHFVGLALKGLLVEPKTCVHHITLEYSLALVQQIQARASHQGMIKLYSHEHPQWPPWQLGIKATFLQLDGKLTGQSPPWHKVMQIFRFQFFSQLSVWEKPLKWNLRSVKLNKPFRPVKHFARLNLQENQS